MESLKKRVQAYVSNQNEDFLRRAQQVQTSDLYPSKAYSPQSIDEVISKGEGNEVKVAGRIMSKRVMKTSSFLTIQDDGQELQIYLNANDGINYETFVKDSDIGDIVGFEGTLFTTNTGELTVRANQYQTLAKSLRPLPDKRKGIVDPHIRETRRHLDMLVNEESRERLLLRSQANQIIRNYLLDEGFVEVETPILQPIYGGANARPFKTIYHAEDNAQAFLRISNELYLKRIIAGGVNKVFEFAKDFRNEGIDKTHNPEFTQLELYEAYEDYFSMMDRVEDIFRSLAEGLENPTPTFMGSKVNLEQPWTRMAMTDSLQEIGGLDIDPEDEEEVVRLAASELDLQSEEYGNALLNLFEEFVEPNLIQPSMIYDYPISVSPLAKNHRSKEGFTERFEFFIAGKEFGNAYSELNDPLEQRLRFLAQLESRDEESHPLDENYLSVLEDGLPQTGGLGIGMDRVCMLFSNTDSIRDVLFFPFKKPRK